MTNETLTLIATVIGAIGVVFTIVYTLNKGRKQAAREDDAERDKALQDAWDKGWASRNDEVSLLKSRLEDVTHDRDRYERRVDALEGRVLEVGRIERPAYQQQAEAQGLPQPPRPPRPQLPPSSNTGDQ